MDICVLGAQVPFMRGGAELHMDNLVAALRAAGHRAELVRLPVAWDRGRLFDAAVAWRLVPLDADLVIATNFPSYFARHPRKVVWLFHQHRAAYELAGTAWSDFGLDDAALEDQRLLTEWDARVLGEAERVYTTSRTVAARLARYNGITGTPLYHPPPLADRLAPGDRLGPGAPGNEVFCPTRLEHNKRPMLAVEAMAHTRSDATLRLAGQGTLAGDLAARVAELGVAHKVALPGFVDDDELVARFAAASAVLYAPIDEDYGYVTLQAFLAAKPVITAADSGGVLEFVEHEVTGLVTDGTPAGVGAAIDRLAADPAFARRLGEAGRERVKDLAWAPVVHELVGA